MSTVDLSALRSLPSYREIAASLSLRSLPWRTAASHQSRDTILILEDSPTLGELARHVASTISPETRIVVAPNWMRAAVELPRARLVVIDWNLSDGITATECGAVDALLSAGVPFFVWSIVDAGALPDLPCPVVAKDSDGQALREALVGALQQSR